EPGGPPCPTLGLAPGGVYLAARSPGSLVRSYRTVSPLPVRRSAIGGLLSVALSCESPRLAVSQHPALWSPDLPRSDPGRARPDRGHLADSPSMQGYGIIPAVDRDTVAVYQEKAQEWRSRRGDRGDGLGAEFRSAAGPGPVVDLGCGVGRYLNEIGAPVV